MTRPPNIIGLRHVALRVRDLVACEAFYGLLGFEVEWRPDNANVYLTSGSDNLALHRVAASDGTGDGGALDHLGIVLATASDVDAWYDFLLAREVVMDTEPKTHRDGARSFYCRDPDGNCVQMIYHPPLADSAK